MALQTQAGAFSPSDAYNAIRSLAFGSKSQAQNAVLSMAAGSVSTDFIFRVLDQLNAFISSMTTWGAIPNLNSYATSQGYTGTMSADCAACITAAQTCIAWVVANFPTDTGGFIQAYKLNADGSRVAATFTSTQTAQLQTNLTAFANTIN